MSEPNVEAVRRWIELWAGLDLVAVADDPVSEAAMLELLDPDVELRWAEELPDVETYRGHEGARAAMAEWLEPWDEFRMEPLEVIDAGDAVVVRYRQTGRGTGSGAETEMEITQVYTVRDGRISRLLEFASHDAALAAAGLSP